MCGKRKFIELKRIDETLNKDDMPNEELLERVTDCLEYHSKRNKLDKKTQITRTFVTNILEVNSKALKQLQEGKECIVDSLEDKTIVNRASEAINLRFIKPSKEFYNRLMSLWLKFDTKQISNISSQDYLDVVKNTLGETWDSNLTKPTENFFNTVKYEWIKIRTYSGSDDSISLPLFFDRVKCSLLKLWNTEVIAKSTNV